MKILWFAHRDLKHLRAGGAERTIYEVGRRLAKMGYDVRLVSVLAKGLRRLDKLDGIELSVAETSVAK